MRRTSRDGLGGIALLGENDLSVDGASLPLVEIVSFVKNDSNLVRSPFCPTFSFAGKPIRST